MKWWPHRIGLFMLVHELFLLLPHALRELGAVPAAFAVPKSAEGEPAEGFMLFVTFPLWMGEDFARESLNSCLWQRVSMFRGQCSLLLQSNHPEQAVCNVRPSWQESEKQRKVSVTHTGRFKMVAVKISSHSHPPCYCLESFCSASSYEIFVLAF